MLKSNQIHDSELLIFNSFWPFLSMLRLTDCSNFERDLQEKIDDILIRHFLSVYNTLTVTYKYSYAYTKRCLERILIFLLLLIQFFVVHFAPLNHHWALFNTSFKLKINQLSDESQNFFVRFFDKFYSEYSVHRKKSRY